MAKTILIVDDDARIRQEISLSLAGEGYDVVDAVDGKDALTKLDGRKINLVISGVNMPNMDGITLVKEMKALLAYKFTPVIMLTTESSEARKLAALMAGAKAWVAKPFLPAQMLNAVSRLALP